MRARWRRELDQLERSNEVTAPQRIDPAPGTVGLDEHGFLVDVGMQALRKRQRELFAANPKCGICNREIVELEDCSPVRLASGEVYLCHSSTACVRESIDRMVRRFADKSRRSA